MSGIVGAWDLGGRPLGAGLVPAMLDRMANRGPDGSSVWQDGTIGLGCALRKNTAESGGEVQPFVHASGAVIVFDGRLDDRDDLIAGLQGWPEADVLASDPELVMAAYEALGESFVEALSGDFAFAIFDPVKQWLMLGRDAIGARPLHFFRTRDTFLFASEISALLEHPAVEAKPNLGQLASYLRESRPFGDGGSATFFEGVHSLLPANVAVVTPSRFVARRYWDFDGTRRIRFDSSEGYREGFRLQLERAVRRRMRTVGGVHVPGGDAPLDVAMRATALEIGRADVSIVTAGQRSPDELASAVVASENPGLAGLEACRMPRDPDAGAVLWGPPAGALFADRAFLMDLAGRFAWRELFAQLDGLSRSSDEPGVYRRFAADFVSAHASASGTRSSAKGSAPVWYAEGFVDSATRPAEAGAKARGDFATHSARSLYGLVRSWRTVLEMESASKVGAALGLEVSFPFMDRDLLSFLMAIPGEERSHPGAPYSILGLGSESGAEPPLDLGGLQDAAVSLIEGATCSRFGVTEQAELALEVPLSLRKAERGDRAAARDLKELLGTEMWLKGFFA